jgi:hypothetical protein
MEMTESSGLSCYNSTGITSAVKEAIERQGDHVEDVLLNCCVEGVGSSLVQAVVSAFELPGVNESVSVGSRYEIHQTEGIAIILRVEGASALNFTWHDKQSCYNCNATLDRGEDMCSACSNYCKVCTGPNNTMSHCLECKYGQDEHNAENGYCLNDCLDMFDKNSNPPCSMCPQYYYLAVKNDTVSESEGEVKYPFQSYQLECVSNCEEVGPGFVHTEVKGSATEFCFHGGIAYCKNSVPIEQCVECYHGTELFSPLYSMEMFEELKEELEEGYHGNTDLEHLLEEFEEKCVGPKVRCLTEEQMEECYEMSVSLQSTQLFLEIQHEMEVRKTKDIALAISLPIVCVAIIACCFGTSVFAHFRYPHVHENKRRRTEAPPEIRDTNTVWRPRSTMYMK